jgi:hypothetical protein
MEVVPVAERVTETLLIQYLRFPLFQLKQAADAALEDAGSAAPIDGHHEVMTCCGVLLLAGSWVQAVNSCLRCCV